MINPLNYTIAQVMRSAFKKAEAEVVYNRLIGAYFSEKRSQRSLAVIATLRATKASSLIYLTYVFRDFINQIESKNPSAFQHELVVLAASSLVMVAADRTQSLMSDRLCRSLTNFSQKEMGRLWVLLYSENRPEVKDPEQRMTNDISEYIKIMQQLSDVPLNIINALVYSYILYRISPLLLAGTLTVGYVGAQITRRVSQKQIEGERALTNATASYRQLISNINGHKKSVLHGDSATSIMGMLDEKLEEFDKAAHVVITKRNLTDTISEVIDNVIVSVPYVMARLVIFNPAMKWTIGSFRQGEDVSHKLNDAVSWRRRKMSLLKQLQSLSMLLTDFLKGCMAA